ncbi:hypothetical protein [Granulicella mallensis]|uniref:Uncharacterized protein n=1 Tax=Granulicella mallensis (strain ATCC BAA-1857 / DSM 23137 / MP5ACTX8) TaxID=682795 RepID=G8NNK2_GRAMM|nr:hypothetical protein [Granulicella mallensis]AEU34787.1 hypothetical protein AciX8_0434 [Granulicella mallensis MP5ACTX8]
MDVHAPHEPIHTWKDFLLHLATITIGLLIALGLEGLVEAAHHRHLLHEAEMNLRAEISSNRQTLAGDEKQLDGTEQEIEFNLSLLAAIKTHQPTSGQLAHGWEWNGMDSAAWNTARDTGAVALMSYEYAQAYSVIYNQQGVVNDQARNYIRSIYRITEPLKGGRKLTDLQPAEVDTMIANAQQTLVELDQLRDLSHSLDLIYAHTNGKL